jgi:hypothetical protein
MAWRFYFADTLSLGFQGCHQLGIGSILVNEGCRIVAASTLGCVVMMG